VDEVEEQDNESSYGDRWERRIRAAVTGGGGREGK
jgi:hypothetical protein